MSANLPILWEDKVNSPELEAYLKQFGKNGYMTAEEINQLRDAVNEMALVQKSNLLGTAEPTDTPTGTGRGYWEIITPGTYTNFGGVILGANQRGLIYRNEVGAFSISKTGLDLSGYVMTGDLLESSNILLQQTKYTIDNVGLEVKTMTTNSTGNIGTVVFNTNFNTNGGNLKSLGIKINVAGNFSLIIIRPNGATFNEITSDGTIGTRINLTASAVDVGTYKIFDLSSYKVEINTGDKFGVYLKTANMAFGSGYTGKGYFGETFNESVLFSTTNALNNTIGTMFDYDVKLYSKSLAVKITNNEAAINTNTQKVASLEYQNIDTINTLAIYLNDPLTVLSGTSGNGSRCGRVIKAGDSATFKAKFKSTANIPCTLYWQKVSDGANLMSNIPVTWVLNLDGFYYAEYTVTSSDTTVDSNLFLFVTNSTTLGSNVTLNTVSIIKSVTLVSRVDKLESFGVSASVAQLEKSIKTSQNLMNGYTFLKVKKNGTGDFLDIQSAINSITTASLYNQYIIDVYDDFEVTDLTQLYKVASPTIKNTLANPTESVAMVIGKDYITVRGFGSKKTLFVNAPYALTGSSFQYVQTIYPKGNFKLENLIVKVKNGRYAIHQESGGLTSTLDYNAKTIYKNLDVEHLGNTNSADGGVSWNSPYAQANGGCAGLKMVFDNVNWKAPIGPVYTHDNVNFDNPMDFEFIFCSMTLNNGGLDSSGTTQYDNLVSISGMGSGQRHNVTIIGCNFFSFEIPNKAWNTNLITDATRDFRNGGAYLKGHGNKPMKTPTFVPDIVSLKSLTLNGTISVVDDSATNVNAAYKLIFGDVYKSYAGTADSYAQVFGSERVVDSSNGSKTFSMAYRLGDCSVTNKTLTIKVDGVDRVMTFNKNYTSLTSGNLTYPFSTILAEINTTLSGYVIAESSALIETQLFQDTYEIGANFSSATITGWGKALVRDYSLGMNGWRLAQAGEKIEGISSERINSYVSGNVSYGKVILKGKTTFGTLNIALKYNSSVRGIMYKASANGGLTTTTLKSEADFIGTGNNTLSWNI
jgi:hypothetical protein